MLLAVVVAFASGEEVACIEFVDVAITSVEEAAGEEFCELTNGDVVVAFVEVLTEDVAVVTVAAGVVEVASGAK